MKFSVNYFLSNFYTAIKYFMQLSKGTLYDSETTSYEADDIHTSTYKK